MPLDPPATPFLASRFYDESLILSTEPIFGDVTLGDGDEEWSRASSLRRIERDKTLDLDAYLPLTDEDGEGDGMIRIEEDVEAGARDKNCRSHERDGSESVVREREMSGPKRRESCSYLAK